MKPPIGWDRIEAAWWPHISAEIKRPWPREAVWFDLRWWEGQVSQKRCARPGRPALQQRWGWSEWETRAVLKSGLWEDPLKTPALQPTSSDSPGDLQPTSNQRTDKRQESRENLQPTSSDSPAILQQTSPRAYSRCTSHVSPTSPEDPRTAPQRTAPLSGSPPPRKATPKNKPPEDPRLRRLTDLWCQVAREEGVEPSLRMAAGRLGVDRLARPAVLQVAGIPVHDGADRWKHLEHVMRAAIRLRAKGTLWPAGAPTFERLTRDWPEVEGRLRKEPWLGEYRTQEQQRLDYEEEMAHAF